MLPGVVPARCGLDSESLPFPSSCPEPFCAFAEPTLRSNLKCATCRLPHRLPLWWKEILTSESSVCRFSMLSSTVGRYSMSDWFWLPPDPFPITDGTAWLRCEAHPLFFFPGLLPPPFITTFSACFFGPAYPPWLPQDPGHFSPS